MRPRSRHRSRATGATSLLVLGVGLTALFLGFEWFWIVFAVGFAVVVPLVATLTGEADSLRDLDDRLEESLDGLGGGSRADSGDNVEESADDDPLATLRRRYAEGELTDDQFERKLELLLETETVEDVEDRARRTEAERSAAIGDLERSR